LLLIEKYILKMRLQYWARSWRKRLKERVYYPPRSLILKIFRLVLTHYCIMIILIQKSLDFGRDFLNLVKTCLMKVVT